MRRLVDLERLRAFMRALGTQTRDETTCYLAGGASAVIVGWRDTTIDVDVDRRQLRVLFAEIEPDLYRFPAIDPVASRTAVEDATEAGPLEEPDRLAVLVDVDRERGRLRAEARHLQHVPA